MKLRITTLSYLLQLWLPLSTVAEWATCVKATPDANGAWQTPQGSTTATCVMKQGAQQPPQGAKRVYKYVDSAASVDQIRNRVRDRRYELPPQYPAAGAVKPICALDPTFIQGFRTADNYYYIDQFWLGEPAQFVITGWFDFADFNVQLCAFGLHDYPNSYDCTCEWRGFD